MVSDAELDEYEAPGNWHCAVYTEEVTPDGTYQQWHMTYSAPSPWYFPKKDCPTASEMYARTIEQSKRRLIGEPFWIILSPFAPSKRPLREIDWRSNLKR